MTLLSLLSVLRLFGISVTLAPPSLTDLDPSHVLTTLSPILSDEAKRALNLANLAPALSAEAKTALNLANINTLTNLAPALTEDANKVLNQAPHIDPKEAAANVESAILTNLDTALDHHHLAVPAIAGLASPFQAASDATTIASSVASPLEVEALNARDHHATPSKSPLERIICTQPSKATTTTATAMHNDISAQVSKGNLSKEGALAAHAALYNVLSPPKTPKLGL